LLVGFWYKQTAAADGARKVLVITHLAGYGFLVGLVLVYARAGSFAWTDPKVAAAFSGGIAALFVVSAMAKSVIYPLHSWIPEAMNAPTPVSALLHSACYVKAGVYLIARMYSLGHGPWHAVVGLPLVALGSATILIGIIFALAENDLKRLLAFSTISQLGYIVVGLAIGTPLGVAAGLFYCLSHALFKATLFMCAGSVQHATGTRDLRRMGGLAASMPLTARIWMIAGAAIIGVPLTNGFVAKWLLLNAALADGLLLVVLVIFIGSILSAFVFLKATVSIFYGQPSPALHGREIHEAPPSMLAGMGATGSLCLVFGVAPQLLMAPVVAPAVSSLGFGWDVGLSWLGVLTSQGGIGVSVGAVVVLLSIVGGLVVYRLAQAPAPAAVSVFAGGEALTAGDRPGGADFAALAEASFQPVYALDPDPLWLAIWAGTKQLAARTESLARAVLERRPPVAIGIAVAASLLAVWLF
jgi:multicomponent Na+:H+ antiporter subunit A